MIQPTSSTLESDQTNIPFASGRSLVWADLMAFCTLALVSLLTGLLLNQASRHPLPLVYRTKQARLHEAVTQLAAATPGVLSAQATAPPVEIGLDDFQAFATAHRGVVIDARLPSAYAEGHVPGALSLSRANFDEDYRHLGKPLSSRKADTIAVYCSGADCTDSELVANALSALGFQHLLVYKEGWEEWAQSGLPQER